MLNLPILSRLNLHMHLQAAETKIILHRGQVRDAPFAKNRVFSAACAGLIPVLFSDKDFAFNRLEVFIQADVDQAGIG